MSGPCTAFKLQRRRSILKHMNFVAVLYTAAREDAASASNPSMIPNLTIYGCSSCSKDFKYAPISHSSCQCLTLQKRIKGAIDSRFAEEQAKAKAAAAAPVRTGSTARRSASLRNESPSKRSRARPKEVDDGARGSDPSVFERAFVIEDDSEEPSRSATPAIPETKPEVMAEKGATAENTGLDEGEVVNEKAEIPPNSSTKTDLPPDVRSKLRKLDKLEARYQGIQGPYKSMDLDTYSDAQNFYVPTVWPMLAQYQSILSKRR